MTQVLPVTCVRCSDWHKIVLHDEVIGWINYVIDTVTLRNQIYLYS